MEHFRREIKKIPSNQTNHGICFLDVVDDVLLETCGFACFLSVGSLNHSTQNKKPATTTTIEIQYYERTTYKVELVQSFSKSNHSCNNYKIWHKDNTQLNKTIVK